MAARLVQEWLTEYKVWFRVSYTQCKIERLYITVELRYEGLPNTKIIPNMTFRAADFTR